MMESLQGFEVVRAAPNAAPVVRASDDTADAGATMEVRFSAFGNWYEIDSYFEGRFLERVAPGSFVKTFRERAGRIRSQFDHGYDTYFGSSPLGVFEVLREDDFGPYFEAMRRDNLIVASNARKHPVTDCFNEIYFEPLGIYSLLDVGITVANQPFGLFCCENTTDVLE
jgi:hypothetical protein